MYSWVVTLQFMNTVAVIFPHQLYWPNPVLENAKHVVLVEESLFFNQYNFHKQKLVFHRSSMMQYAERLISEGHQVQYIDATQENAAASILFKELTQKFNSIHICNPSDDWLLKHIQKAIQTTSVDLVIHPSPNFLKPLEESHLFFDGKNRYFQTDFYALQRKSLNILVDEKGKPVGGKLTFDSENRKAFPKNTTMPTLPFPLESQAVKEAKTYIDTHFPKNLGNINFTYENQFYPTNHAEAQLWLTQFIEQRLMHFGEYEDAFSKDPDQHFLYHSVLSPLLNIGLLSPKQIIDQTLEYATKNEIPLNSLEGFIRQIIGWREFIRVIYKREGSTQRTSNFWNFSRQIPPSFYNGTTGIEPIDTVIKKALTTSYSHHIERLMIVGNFFLLCEFNPNAVYQWFMEMYIDAYDWVMVPNIYGMSQFADGGLMTTKPYFSGSNYIVKMSDYKKGDGHWQVIWDALFWRFINRHRTFLQQNPRLGMLIITFDKMSTEKQDQHLNIAEDFLQKLDLELNS